MPGLWKLGGQGPKLLILHATGFHGAAYSPLAAALQPHFECYALDFPGHGLHSGVILPRYDVPAFTDYLVKTVTAHRLQGCFCFGHSGGGAFALLAAAMSPGLFAGIYSFEAVVATPATHTFMREMRAAGSLHTAGQSLSAMARRRRVSFGSQQEALHHLAKRPPFAGMHPDAVRLYVQHGTKQQATATDMLQSSPAADQRHEQQQQPHQQQLAQPEVQLVCAPSIEAAYYEALDPPPAVPTSGITCPVLMAVAGNSSSNLAAYRQHAAVTAWLMQHPTPKMQQQGQESKQQTAAAGRGSSSGSSSSSSAGHDPLHGVLQVLNTEVAALCGFELQEVPGVSHFGPLEQPQLLAERCAAFFQQLVGSSSSSSGSSGSGSSSSSNGSSGSASSSYANRRKNVIAKL